MARGTRGQAAMMPRPRMGSMVVTYVNARKGMHRAAMVAPRYACRYSVMRSALSVIRVTCCAGGTVPVGRRRALWKCVESSLVRRCRSSWRAERPPVKTSPNAQQAAATMQTAS